MITLESGKLPGDATAAEIVAEIRHHEEQKSRRALAAHRLRKFLNLNFSVEQIAATGYSPDCVGHGPAKKAAQ